VSNDDETISSPRAGTYADLSRRMDRMDQRQDTLESRFGELTAVVARVDENQHHSTELAKLRFDALDSKVALISTDLKGFMTRMEGIMTGEIKTAASRDLAAAKEQAEREGAKIMREWSEWREELDTRLEAMEDREQRRAGFAQAFTGTKAVILMIMAIASPIVAAIGIIVTRPPGQ
jgi:hypothetical protein